MAAAEAKVFEIKHPTTPEEQLVYARELEAEGKAYLTNHDHKNALKYYGKIPLLVNSFAGNAMVPEKNPHAPELKEEAKMLGFQAYLAMAKCQIALFKWSNAWGVIDQALKIQPDHPELIAMHGNVAQELVGHAVRLEAEAKRHRFSKPADYKNALKYYGKIPNYAKDFDADDSKASFGSSEKTAPPPPVAPEIKEQSKMLRFKANLGMATCHAKLKEWKSAKPLIEQAVAFQPNHVQANIMYGHIATQLTLFDIADRCFALATEQGGEVHPAYRKALAKRKQASEQKIRNAYGGMFDRTN
jgi:tetratricopeptide (TPR) repeat protein